MNGEFINTPESDRVENLYRDTNRNFLVLGSAGTGKSLLLRRLVEGSRKNVMVVAPTGLAAVNAGGQTIHRFFGFPIGLQPRREVVEPSENRRQMFRDLQALLIDEVSMVRADLLDAVDAVLREHGPKPGEPFGGVQIGMFGDVLQLPPIVDDDLLPAFNTQWAKGWPSPWFFDAFSYRCSAFQRVTLTKIFRQLTEDHEGADFIRVLQRLREGRAGRDELRFLNSRFTNVRADDSVALVTTNNRAEVINQQKFGALAPPVKSFAATDEAWPPAWNGDEPVPRTVDLKIGARVLMCANDASQGLVNGSTGNVIRFDGDDVILKVGDFERRVRRYTWEYPVWRWNGEEMVRSGVAKYRQMPLKLAWAMTIHKAQGQTIEGNVWVDLGRIWSGGQTYVALSRGRRIEQLHLGRQIAEEDMIVEKHALDFLAEGDSAVSLEEVRSKAAVIYRETAKIRREAEAERQAVEVSKQQVETLVLELRNIVTTIKTESQRIESSEKMISGALERARKAGWLRRLFGDF